MKTQAKQSSRTADARQDLEDALDRLSRGKPRCPELVELAKAGKLRINVATVAEEAGRSRTLIALKNCQFPDIRDRILQVKHGSARPEKGVTGIAARLRKENSALRQQVEMLRSQQALALSRMLEAERETRLVQGDLARRRVSADSRDEPAATRPFLVRPPPRSSRAKR